MTFDIFPFSEDALTKLLGNNFRSRYLINYLKEIGAKTCILEKNYIDKDYIIDYQKFYARSFEEYGKFTKRVHFFASELSRGEFEQALEKNRVNEIQESYLGFIVVRPIKSSTGDPLIGRTILKTYPVEEGADRRYFVTEKYCASLFGIPLEVNSLPFQEQDQGVSACATIALWSALNPLHSKFGIFRHSPAEITEVATSFPSPSRAFPTTGLILDQMINYIRSISLDVEVIRALDNDIITTAVKAYVQAGFPIIAILKLESTTESSMHAAVISGYRSGPIREVKELYVHDDQIGPYCRVKPCGDFRVWKNEWIELGYNITLEKLLIPIYPKIRLTFSRIYAYYQKLNERVSSIENLDLSLELNLASIQSYKKFLLQNDIKNKINVLTKPMPRFLWIIRMWLGDSILVDNIFDGVSTYPKLLTKIFYK